MDAPPRDLPAGDGGARHHQGPLSLGAGHRLHRRRRRRVREPVDGMADGDGVFRRHRTCRRGRTLARDAVGRGGVADVRGVDGGDRADVSRDLWRQPRDHRGRRRSAARLSRAGVDGGTGAAAIDGAHVFRCALFGKPLFGNLLFENLRQKLRAGLKNLRNCQRQSSKRVAIIFLLYRNDTRFFTYPGRHSYRILNGERAQVLPQYFEFERSCSGTRQRLRRSVNRATFSSIKDYKKPFVFGLNRRFTLINS